MISCLEKLVGATQIDCDCVLNGLTDEEKAALQESASGVFITDLPGMVQLSAVKNIDSCRNLAQIFLEARDKALQNLGDDLIVAIANRYTKAAKNYVGAIGRPSYAMTLSNTRQFQGIRIRPVNHTDATFRITRFRIIGNAATTVRAYIVRTYYNDNGRNGEVVFSADVNTSANNYSTVTIPDGGIILPLHDGNLDPYDYWIFWDRMQTGFLPKDCKVDCNCSSSARVTLEQYFDIQGTSFSDPANMQFSGTLDGYTHGIILDVDLKCETGPLICREKEQSEQIAVALAAAAQYRAGWRIINEIRRSPEVNRFTLQDKEFLLGRMSHYDSQYNARVNYIATAIDVSASDCFECAEGAMFFRKIKP